MAIAPVGYNERAWGVDIVSEVNAWVATRSLAIKRASGELSLGGGRTLFPDVIIHGDAGGESVLQGWELKLPDTEVADLELLDNATVKARRLGLNSFLVWNAAVAVLHVLGKDETFSEAFRWTCPEIRTRSDVQANAAAWKRTLNEILDVTCRFFAEGRLRAASPGAALGEDLLTDYLRLRQSIFADHVRLQTQRDGIFEADLQDWWTANQFEHPGLDKFHAFARTSIVAWVIRLLFAHLLKKTRAEARTVDSFVRGTTVAHAVVAFMAMSAQCDFSHILRPGVLEQEIDQGTWQELLTLNRFLSDVDVAAMPLQAGAAVLDTALNAARKKSAGQYATPQPLAEFLVGIAMRDRTGPALDPCCGTGTIARAIYDEKVRVGIPPSAALSGLWSGDRYAFPLQLATMALAEPAAYGTIIQAFQHDALDLEVDRKFEFTDPVDGAEVERHLPRFQTIVSNLPFVRFETRPGLRLPPGITAKSDLYAVITAHLATLVEEQGRVGLIVSNSWLGTQWGPAFRAEIGRLFHIEIIAISGAGRWFSNAKVVTTILVLAKRAEGDLTEQPVKFVVTLEQVAKWAAGNGGVRGLSNRVLATAPPPARIRRSEVAPADLRRLEGIGVGWGASFADTSWIGEVAPKLVRLSRLFSFSRGERWGQNKLFYPRAGHGIEDEYITRFFKRSSTALKLEAYADTDVFSCDLTIDELINRGHHGTVAWIKSFENVLARNRPLPEILAREDRPWYSRRSALRPNFALSINAGRRLAVYSLPERNPVDQRFTPMTLLSEPDDLVLWHAILNCSVSLYWIEAMGFGRGLGALDLNKDKVRDCFFVLNPAFLDEAGRNAVKEAFAQLLLRDIQNVPEEIASPERRALDDAAERGFGLQLGTIEKARNSLLELFLIRNAVLDGLPDDVGEDDDHETDD
jgi:hypothetical protein